MLAAAACCYKTLFASLSPAQNRIEKTCIRPVLLTAGSSFFGVFVIFMALQAQRVLKVEPGESCL